MSSTYKSNMRKLKVDSQHFLCFLHFVVDFDLHKFPEMSQVPSKQFSIPSTSYRLHNTCSFLISTASVCCYKNEPHFFFFASNNAFAIKVILQISSGPTKNMIYFYHHYCYFSKEIHVKDCVQGKGFRYQLYTQL